MDRQLCKVKDFISKHQAKNQLFRELTKKKLKERMVRLQQTRLSKNHRRQANSKLSDNFCKAPVRFNQERDRLNQYCQKSAESIWLEMVRLVWLMIRMYGAMKQRGCKQMKITYRGIMNEFKFTINNNDVVVDPKSVKVNYNYKDYAVSDKVTVPAEAIKCMMKSPSLRTHEDLTLIYTLMMTLPVFQDNYTHTLKWALAKNLRYFRCDAKRMLTSKNRKFVNVYFIYSGSVSVMLQSNESSVQKMITLRRGSCIGHTAKSQLCLCATNCEFLWLYKDEYLRDGIHAVESNNLEKRFDFFRSWPPFGNWSDNAIYDISNLSYTDSYSSGTLILLDKLDEEMDILWFVLAGKVDVVKVVIPSTLNKRLLTKDNLTKKMEKRSRISNMYDYSHKRLESVREVAKCQKSKVCKSIKDFEYMSQLYNVQSKKHSTRRQSEKVVAKELPVYLRMRTLQEGDCYGLDNAEEGNMKFRLSNAPKTTNRFCLVSRGCMVVRLSCIHFKDLTQTLGVDKQQMNKVVHSYYDDDSIQGMMQQEVMWKEFKQFTVESEILTNPTLKKYTNFKNHLKHTATHLAVTAKNHANYMFPLPTVNVGGMKVVNSLYKSLHHPLIKNPFTRCSH